MNSVIVAVLILDIHLPGSLSLKDKRMVLRSLKDKVSKKFNVSVAELNYLDKWQRSQIGIAQIGNEYGFLEKSIDTIFRMIDNIHELEVIDHSVEYV
ncbi:MAG: DUF503 domain-containing protein [Calditrichia bacterium]